LSCRTHAACGGPAEPRAAKLLADLRARLRVEDEHHAVLVGILAVEAALEGSLDELALAHGLQLRDALLDAADLGGVVLELIGREGMRLPGVAGPVATDPALLLVAQRSPVKRRGIRAKKRRCASFTAFMRAWRASRRASFSRSFETASGSSELMPPVPTEAAR